MAGFALAFTTVFGSCNADSLLGESFGSFGTAFLSVFEAPLGEFSFEDFHDVGTQCPDNPAPGRASDAGTFLLVVNANGEKEFHLARTRLILQSARAVAHRRIPPPLNLVQLIVDLLLDTVGELAWWVRLDAGR
ncbi:unnamed protein product [Ectocarpus sp. 12 AP-2014]